MKRLFFRGCGWVLLFILVCTTAHAGQAEAEITALLDRYGDAFADENTRLISSLYLADDRDALSALNRTLSAMFETVDVDSCSFAIRSIQLSAQGQEALVLAEGRTELSDPSSSDSIVDANDLVIDLVRGPYGWRIRRMIRQTELELADRLRAGRRVGDRLAATSGSRTDTTSRPHKTTKPGNRAPVAAFNYMPSAPEVDETVVFVSTSSDPDGDAITHAWSVDGPYEEDIDYLANSANGEYEFVDPGEFTITLEVQDGRGGRDSVTRAITIIGEDYDSYDDDSDDEEWVSSEVMTGDEELVYPDAVVVDEGRPGLDFTFMPHSPRAGDPIVVTITTPVSELAGLMLFWHVDGKYFPKLDNLRNLEFSGFSEGDHTLELEWFRNYERESSIVKEITVLAR